MSAGAFQLFSTHVRNVRGESVQHCFIVESRAATDHAARLILPRLVQVLNVPMPTDPEQIAANLRHIKNCMTAYQTIERNGNWFDGIGGGCRVMLPAATTHFCTHKGN